MTTTPAAKATSDQRQAARQRRSPTARRSTGSEPPPHASTRDLPLPLMVSTVLPDEQMATLRDAEIRAGLLRREQIDPERVRTYNIELDVALAELAAGQHTVPITSDPVGMADTVLDVLSHGGWPALLELIQKVEALRVVNLTEGVYAAANEAIYDIVPQLAEIEDRAREIIDCRLDVSEEQVKAARVTFLAGPGVDTLPVAQLKATKWRLKLRPGPHLEALRSMLADLAPSNQMVEHERRAVRSQRELSSRNPSLRYILDRSVQRLRAFELRRAERIQEVAQYWPLVSWLEGTDPQVKDEELLDQILNELEIVTEAINTVRHDITARGAWPTDVVSGAESEAGVRPARVFPGTSLTNPFTRNMRRPRGPWRYPLMIDAATTELGHRPPSPVYAAAKSVTAGSNEYDGLSWVLTGATVAVGVAAPPVGVALGVVSALWNVFHDADDYADQVHAHRAVLDPALSLAVPPTTRQVEASIIGLVGSAIPGLVPGLAFGVGEAVMRVDPDKVPQ